ncbi:alveolar macrophage chemotactic factor-like isoform X1 [Acipenser oxyrinchus oxyrinchus]|uniref:Alveolar macrophage chemotactic factor-like isoform X1 n=1 Tax=Acipenser oxyrinchus oxyrinchus TaxID=40147 RepID=A0AAD8G2W1_ACIOX|nr:alveolar macrophage chemotactic factor-like isoform X1 [Acipenser oxyrinchus oxyrinchus]
MVCRVILLALLTVCIASAVDVSGHSGSRCLCRTVKEGLPVRRITKVEIIPRSRSCDNIEIIATLKNGIQVCLNPEAPRVQKALGRLMERNSSKPNPTI